MRRGPRHHGERGLLRFLGVVLLTAVATVVALAGWTYLRMTASPDLGAPPQGPSHGTTDAELATFALSKLVALLDPLAGHATVVFSEQDLTHIAEAKAPSRLSSPEVRIRGGTVLFTGDTTVVGVDVTAVGSLGLHLVTDSDGLPDVGVTIDEIDAGRWTLPGFLTSAIGDKILAQVQLSSVLDADARLRLLRPALECVAVAPDGVVLGFHGPLSRADPSTCTRS